MLFPFIFGIINLLLALCQLSRILTKRPRQLFKIMFDKEKIREVFLAKNPRYRPEQDPQVYTPEKKRMWWKTARENLKKNHYTKWKTRNLFKVAIKYGKIKRMPCEVCGNVKSEGHHSDYTKPYEVKWLCRKHHKELHDSL